MKKNILRNLFVSLMIFGSFASVQAVLADDYGLGTTADVACKTGACYSQTDTPYSITTTIINVALGFTFLAFLLLSILAGFRWMLARGNEEHVTTAKHTLEAAIIGLVIISAAYAITNVLMDKLGAQ